MTVQKTVRIEAFQGLDNKAPYNGLAAQERDVIKTYLKEAVNIDILATGKFARRAGAVQLNAAEHHSLWGHPNRRLAFVVRNGVLGLVGADFSFTALTAIGQRLLTYTDANHEVYLSDNNSVWVYDTTTGVFEVLDAPGSYQRNMFQLDMAENETYFSTPIPGYALAFGYGRLLVGNQYGLFFSQFGFPRRFDEENDFIPFEDLTVIGVVDDGIYLGADGLVYFLSGDNLKRQNFKLVSHYPAVRGTLLHTEANKFGVDGAAGRAVIWETKEGKVLGLNSGRVVNLTQDHVSYPVAEIGASLIRELNGQVHHLSTFPTGESAGNPRVTDLTQTDTRSAPARRDDEGFRATDIVTAEVRRAGVII